MTVASSGTHKGLSPVNTDTETRMIQEDEGSPGPSRSQWGLQTHTTQDVGKDEKQRCPFVTWSFWHPGRCFDHHVVCGWKEMRQSVEDIVEEDPHRWQGEGLHQGP